MNVAPIRALFLALIALLPPGSALAAGGELMDEPTSTLELGYRLYAGGIPLGQVDFSSRVRGDSYTAASTLETLGIANALWEARLEATSYGTLGERKLHPANYDAFSIHAATDGKRQQVTLAYTDGLPTVTPNPPYRDTISIRDDDKRDTLDPVSALVLSTMSYDAHTEQPCKITAPVFDGRRRYTVSLDFVRNTDVNMDSGLYRGPVQVCRLNYEPVAGARQRVFEGGNVPNVFAWVTTIQSDADPGRHYVLPLRIWAETDYGIVVALLTTVRVDGVAKPSLN